MKNAGRIMDRAIGEWLGQSIRVSDTQADDYVLLACNLCGKNWIRGQARDMAIGGMAMAFPLLFMADQAWSYFPIYLTGLDGHSGSLKISRYFACPLDGPSRSLKTQIVSEVQNGDFFYC